MTTTQYIGPRIIPVFAPEVEWDIDTPYDHLTMVQHQGETFMSRQFVPAGIQLPDSSQSEEYNDYWVHMSNWNAQVEAYREEVLLYNGRISSIEDALPVADFDSDNTIKDSIDDLQDQIGTGFDSTDTISAAVTKLIAQDDIRPIAFATVSAMKASDDLKDGIVVKTDGFRSSGDDGESWYVITDTGIANEMNVIACGDLYATLIVGDSIKPEQLGAYGDNTHDDSSYIEKACDLCNTVILGSKTYYIETETEVKGHIIGNGSSVRSVTADRIASVFKIVGDFEIEGITFENHCTVVYTAVDYPNVYNICIKSSTNAYNVNVHNCVFNDVYNKAVDLYSCTGAIEINDNVFKSIYGNRWMAQFVHLQTCDSSSTPINVNNNTFIGNKDPDDNFCGIFIATIISRPSINITNNTFIGCGRSNSGSHRLCAIDEYSYCRNMHITDNKILDCPHSAARMESISQSEFSRNYITFYGSRIFEWGIFANAYDNGDIPNGKGSLVIDSNVFAFNEIEITQGILIGGSQNIVSNMLDEITISNNKLFGYYDMAISIGDYSHTKKLVIKDNQIKNVTNGLGIVLATNLDNSDIEIVDNVIEHCSHAIQCNISSANSVPVVIRNNTLNSPVSSAIEGSSGGDITVVNNYIYGQSGIEKCKNVGFNTFGSIVAGAGGRITNCTNVYQNYQDGTLITD